MTNNKITNSGAEELLHPILSIHNSIMRNEFPEIDKYKFRDIIQKFYKKPFFNTHMHYNNGLYLQENSNIRLFKGSLDFYFQSSPSSIIPPHQIGYAYQEVNLDGMSLNIFEKAWTVGTNKINKSPNGIATILELIIYKKIAYQDFYKFCKILLGNNKLQKNTIPYRSTLLIATKCANGLGQLFTLRKKYVGTSCSHQKAEIMQSAKKITTGMKDAIIELSKNLLKH